jgi:hypothetical protein
MPEQRCGLPGAEVARMESVVQDVHLQKERGSDKLSRERIWSFTYEYV